MVHLEDGCKKHGLSSGTLCEIGLINRLLQETRLIIKWAAEDIANHMSDGRTNGTSWGGLQETSRYQPALKRYVYYQGELQKTWDIIRWTEGDTTHHPAGCRGYRKPSGEQQEIQNIIRQAAGNEEHHLVCYWRCSCIF